jgi:hypothetical protein
MTDSGSPGMRHSGLFRHIFFIKIVRPPAAPFYKGCEIEEIKLFQKKLLRLIKWK